MSDPIHTYVPARNGEDDPPVWYCYVCGVERDEHPEMGCSDCAKTLTALSTPKSNAVDLTASTDEYGQPFVVREDGTFACMVCFIRSHPDVIRLVAAARRVWKFNREKGSPLGDYDMIADLDAALAPFEETKDES